MKLKLVYMKILLAFIAVVVTIILFKNQIFRQVERFTSAKLNNDRTCNYLDINDDNRILKDKADFYKLPDTQPEKQVSANLQKFLINYYSFPINDYTDACSQKNPICTKDNSKFTLTNIDLNSDGKKEYIVMPWEVCGCLMRGASNDDDTLIVRIEDNKYEIIGNLDNSNGYVISKNKTNGYYDILANSHSSYATGTETLYKYQTFSNGMKTNGKYEFVFSKWYDFTRINKQ